MSKSSKVQPIRPTVDHDDVTDIVQVTQTEIAQAMSIVDLARAKLGDDHADVEYALAAASAMLDRSWDRLNGCQGRVVGTEVPT